MDTTQYLDVFVDESIEHLDTLSEKLLQLEKAPANHSVIEEIFRAAHTVKGMSATMSYQDVADLTHHLENVLDNIRNHTLVVNAELIDLLFHAVDSLHEMIEDIASGGTGNRNVQQIVKDLEEICQAPNNEIDTIETKHEPSQISRSTIFATLDEFELAILNESTARSYENYEITVKLNEDCLLKGARVFMVFEVLEKLGEVVKSIPSVNELEEEKFDDSFSLLFISKHESEKIKASICKISEVQHIDIQQYSVQANQSKNEDDSGERTASKIGGSNEVHQTSVTSPRKTIRVNIERLDALMNLFEEFVIDRGRLEQISSELDHSELRETVENISRVSGDLQDVILTMRMVPIDHVFSRFPGMIRQLSRELNKDVVTEIIGAETELDRIVIDEIGDPLVHLIRNAIDHGIEIPEERYKQGKPKQGTIKLVAYHSGNHVIIEINDDGSGIDKCKVLTKAIDNKIITPDQSQSLTDQQVYELILKSGFSTTNVVSDISGRGVGLDVVKNTIESLGGSISIHSNLNEGSTFSIQLPLSLSIIPVLLIELNDEKYAIPLSAIIETTVIPRDHLFYVHNKKVIDFRGQVVPLVDLKKIFGISQYEEELYFTVVIVKRGDKLAGLMVDSFIGQQEVVLKSLGNYLTNTFAISGATILGDGEVVLVIDSNSLVK